MPYDDKTLKRDGSGITPVPQHFNPIADDYEPIYGRNNAGRVELYGPDGNPISTSAGKLAVSASEVESLLNDIKGKDFATQTTLAAILAKIIAAPATEAKQTALNALVGEVQAAPTANTLLARLKSLEDKIDAITAGTTPAVTQLSGSILAEANATNVTTAGTRVQLPNVSCREVTIIAKRTNTGYIYAGKNTVSSTVYGVELAAKDSFTFPVKNANEIYIDSSVSGEGISYVAI